MMNKFRNFLCDFSSFDSSSMACSSSALEIFPSPSVSNALILRVIWLFLNLESVRDNQSNKSLVKLRG